MLKSILLCYHILYGMPTACLPGSSLPKLYMHFFFLTFQLHTVQKMYDRRLAMRKLTISRVDVSMYFPSYITLYVTYLCSLSAGHVYEYCHELRLVTIELSPSIQIVDLYEARKSKPNVFIRHPHANRMFIRYLNQLMLLTML